MHLVSIFLLAFSWNVDNLAVGIAYGLKKIKIGFFTNLFIALISALGTFLAVSIGKDLLKYINPTVANALGSAILVGMGVWEIRKTMKREKKKKRTLSRIRAQKQALAGVGFSTGFSEQGSVATMDEAHEEFSQDLIHEFSYAAYIENPAKADTDKSGYIDIRESVSLAFGLTLNNLGGGVGAGVSAINVMIMTLVTFIFSILAIMGGYLSGDRFATKLPGFWAGTISGMVMIVVGIYEYFVV